MAKILVAEDDAFLSRLLVQSLQLKDHEVHAAFDGVQALEQVRAWRPQIILLDLLMPTLDGYGVLEELQKDSESRDIPVVVLTNVSSQADIERVKKYHVADYLVKANTGPHDLAVKISEMVKE